MPWEVGQSRVAASGGYGLPAQVAQTVSQLCAVSSATEETRPSLQLSNLLRQFTKTSSGCDDHLFLGFTKLQMSLFYRFTASCVTDI